MSATLTSSALASFRRVRGWGFGLSLVSRRLMVSDQQEAARRYVRELAEGQKRRKGGK
jgi:hypothetical protein